MTQPPPIDWTMWEAIGTIFAACVALVLGLRDIISRNRNKPDIVLERLPDEKYVTRYVWTTEQHEKHGGNLPQDWWQFNIKIRNKGSITAKTVRVKIESLIQDGSNIIDFHYSNVIILLAPFLHNEESVIFQLVRVDFLKDKIFFPRCANLPIERKNVKITLLVTGDNFRAYRKSFEFIDSTDRDKIELRCLNKS